jgi:hypothetical protein
VTGDRKEQVFLLSPVTAFVGSDRIIYLSFFILSDLRASVVCGGLFVLTANE